MIAAKRKDARRFFDLENKELTLAEYCEYVDLAESTVKKLYIEYLGDTASITNNHGRHSGSIRAKPIDPNEINWVDFDGKPVSCDEFCELVGLTRNHAIKLYRQKRSVDIILNSHGDKRLEMLSKRMSIAEECKKRLGLGRDLQVGSGFIMPEKSGLYKKPIKYLDENGNPIKLRTIALKYRVHPKTVRNVFVRNNLDYIAANKELGARL